jgi:hypothetical protein
MPARSRFESRPHQAPMAENQIGAPTRPTGGRARPLGAWQVQQSKRLVSSGKDDRARCKQSPSRLPARLPEVQEAVASPGAARPMRPCDGPEGRTQVPGSQLVPELVRRTSVIRRCRGAKRPNRPGVQPGASMEMEVDDAGPHGAKAIER